MTGVDEAGSGGLEADEAGACRADHVSEECSDTSPAPAPVPKPPGPLLLGVRHHGPGSARAVRAALAAARPRVVLIEGPPEADALIPLAADEDMRPPVALLAHAVDEPGRSAFWPLAEFSPEWVAIRWALEHQVPARFIDLPATHTLAWGRQDEAAALDVGGGEGREAESGGDVQPGADGSVHAGAEGGGQEGGAADVGAAGDGAGDGTGGRISVFDEADDATMGGLAPEAGAASGPASEADPGGGPAPEVGPGSDRSSDSPDIGAVDRGDPRADVRVDPLAVLADAAGYDDPERWWEDVVEHRGLGDGDAFAPFLGLEEAMGALREAYGSGGHERGLVREAYMRLQVRAAQREFGDEVAVVCGAWHVPALRRKSTVAADKALLKGVPKVKADMTWVPWTYRRLARVSGYGAGIDSPGWYGHLFGAPDRPVERWMTKVAGLLRDEDRIVSSAHVIEAVRLAETLAAMRGRPLPGLGETTDAVRAVMCEGSDVPLALVHDRLVVGDVLGEVPPSAPAVPLQRDLDRIQRRLRLKPEALERELELDLRKENDAGRSRLLHRLRLLGVEWGEPVVSRGSTGTFRETWRLRWDPELSVRVAEAGVWGTTVFSAATAKVEGDAVAAQGLADVTALAERCLLAELPDALPAVMRILADRAALDADVGHLAQALPALVRSLRYGDVRGTDTGALTEVAAGLAERIFVGLPPACAALDADAAEEMRRHVDAVHGAVGLLGDAVPSGRQFAGSEASASGRGTLGEVSAPGRGAQSEAAVAGHGGQRESGSPSGHGGQGGGGARSGHGGQGGGGVRSERGAQGEGDTPSGCGTPSGNSVQGESGTPSSGCGVPGHSDTSSSAPELGHGDLRTRWRGVLRVLSGRDAVPGVVRGRAVRLLLDDGELAQDEAARLMGLALSPGTPPGDAAAWIEGFVGGGSGGGMLLVHDERLLGLVDAWLTGVSAEAFTDVLPLLRRTFSAYEPGVRRTLGELVRRGPGERGSARAGGSGIPGFAAELDLERADAVLPVVRLLLGLHQVEEDVENELGEGDFGENDFGESDLGENDLVRATG